MYPEFRNIFTVFVSVESELPRSVGLNSIPISRHLCEGMHVDITLTYVLSFQERFP